MIGRATRGELLSRLERARRHAARVFIGHVLDGEDVGDINEALARLFDELEVMQRIAEGSHATESATATTTTQ